MARDPVEEQESEFFEALYPQEAVAVKRCLEVDQALTAQVEAVGAGEVRRTWCQNSEGLQKGNSKSSRNRFGDGNLEDSKSMEVRVR